MQPEMSQTTYFFPVPFAAANAGAGARAVTHQDPSSRSDAPAAGAPSTAGAAGAASTTQTPGAGQSGQPVGPCADGGMLWMMPLFLVLMYFMMIRPEQKRKKEQQSLLASIAQGDRVVTISGMHGVVSALTDKTVTLRVDTVNMTFDRTSVARIERDEKS